MRIIKLFKHHILALIAAVTLIVISCNADLALPTYMSDIVDVGIQQSGIASSVPDTIRADSLEDLKLFMSSKDAQRIDAAYTKANKKGIRTFKGAEADRAEDGVYTDIISLPETVVLALQKGIDADTLPQGKGASSESATAGQSTESQSGAVSESGAAGLASSEVPSSATGASSYTDMTPEELVAMQEKAQAAADMQQAMSAADGKLTMDAVRIGIEGGLIDRKDLVKAANKMADKMGSMSGSIVTQRAVSYVKKEYRAQGIKIADVQNAYLGSMAAKMFGLCLVSLVATILTGAVASHTACTIARDLRRETFTKVMHFSPAEVGKFSQASLITRCTNDIQQIQMASTLFIRMVLMAPIMGVVAVMRVLANHTGLEWTIGVAIIAVSAVVGALMGLTMPKFKRMQAYVDRVNLVAREILDGLMPIRSFGRQDYELERFDKASSDLMTTQLFTNRAMSFMMPLMMLVMNCMAFMILTMVSVILPRAEVAAERVEAVLDTESSVQEPTTPRLPLENGPHGQLAFNDVSFAYPDADENVIEHISFTIEAGQMLGIIGSTGSGKSTLVQLVPRLYDVSAGSITLDGIDVRDMPLGELRRRIGYIPQQGRLFSGTVESNLKFAGDAVSDDDMHRAARIAQATDFIEEREDGFSSPISQGGSNVSGGQRQRLSIARALAKNPEIAIFDDSFSALDYKTDAALREALGRELTDTALVVVAQRIATIMHADKIIVLDEGHVVGSGTHEELLRSCPTYLEIAQSQLSADELGLTDAEIAQIMKGGVC